MKKYMDNISRMPKIKTRKYKKKEEKKKKKKIRQKEKD